MYSHPCPAHWPDEGSSRFDRHPVRNQGGTKLLRGMISPVHCLSKEQQKGGRPPEPLNLSLLSHPSTQLFQLKGRQEGSLPDTALRHWVVLRCLFVKTWWRGGCLQVAGPLSPAPSGWRPQETDNSQQNRLCSLPGSLTGTRQLGRRGSTGTSSRFPSSYWWDNT